MKLQEKSIEEKTINLFNNKKGQWSTKVTLTETGYLLIAEDDVCIELDPEEVESFFELITTEIR